MATNETGKAAAERYQMVSRRISDAVELAVIAQGDQVAQASAFAMRVRPDRADDTEVQ